MANTENSKNPKVSKLPLPISDSPLVIDLPDGQKLVVGQMSKGTVIEVATWRGTGRPDSRTSRLMLGMSSASAVNVDDENNEKSDSKEPKIPSSGYQKYAYMLTMNFKKALRILVTFAQKSLPSLKKLKIRFPSKLISFKKNSEPRVHVASPEQNEEITRWLNEISEKAAKSESAKKSRAKKATKGNKKRKGSR